MEHTHTHHHHQHRLGSCKVIKTKIILSSDNFRRLQFLFDSCLPVFVYVWTRCSLDAQIHTEEGKVLLRERSLYEKCQVPLAFRCNGNDKWPVKNLERKQLPRNLFRGDKVLKMDCLVPVYSRDSRLIVQRAQAMQGAHHEKKFNLFFSFSRRRDIISKLFQEIPTSLRA